MSTSAYAIIASGGKQHRVSEGDVIDVELLSQKSGDKYSFEHILFVNDGKKSHVGVPHLSTFQVLGLIQNEEVKGPKVTSLKFERRENNRKKWGHRQKYTRVKITAIKKSTTKKAAAKKTAPAKQEESTKE